jgi:hypothetical protein
MDVSEMSPLDQVDAVLRTMRDLVYEMGLGYIYERRLKAGSSSMIPSCFYVYAGEPDCLVGQVLHRLGFSVDFLSGCEGDNALQIAMKAGFANEAGSVLFAAQRAQDDGATWGTALSEAYKTAYEVLRRKVNAA